LVIAATLVPLLTQSGLHGIAQLFLISGRFAEEADVTGIGSRRHSLKIRSEDTSERMASALGQTSTEQRFRSGSGQLLASRIS